LVKVFRIAAGIHPGIERIGINVMLGFNLTSHIADRISGDVWVRGLGYQIPLAYAILYFVFTHPPDHKAGSGMRLDKYRHRG